MSLFEEMGLDENEFIWQDLALCQTLPTTLFYDDYEQDKYTAQQVDSCCLSCPVIKSCFFMGAKGEHGVFGGVYWNGAGKPDKNKNAHKTEEVWAEIHDKVNK